MTSPGRQLRDALAAPGTKVIPAIFDALSARLVHDHGFPAACLGSSTVSNTLFGGPDAGLLTLTDMEYMLRRTAMATDLPILVDVDNGYGNAANAVHTTRVLESAGAAGIMMEDQAFPPRTPGMGACRIVPVEEMVGKVKAACDARASDDFFIIARSDAWVSEGLGAAIRRVNAYAEAGADCVFLVARSDAELVRIGREVDAAFRMIPYGTLPDAAPAITIPLNEYASHGIEVAATGIQLVWAAAAAMSSFLAGFARDPQDADAAVASSLRGTPMERWARFTGMSHVNDVDRRYGVEEAPVQVNELVDTCRGNDHVSKIE
jgi:2-methylisocitrate lyase-like PEP mutase family enzyme